MTAVMPASPSDAAAFAAAAVEELQALDRPELVDARPGAALVRRLDSLRLAMQAQDARGLRRRVGLFGRLMGRDVALAVEAEALAARLGVLLLDADRAADALAAHAARQDEGRARIEAACLHLAALETQGRAWIDQDVQAPDAGPAGPLGDALQRRLDHLRALQASHGLAARQLALLQEQNTALLARYRNIRDVLLPAWRQRAFGDAAARGAVRAGEAADLEAAIASEVEAMAGTLDPGEGPARPSPSTQQESAA